MPVQGRRSGFHAIQTPPPPTLSGGTSVLDRLDRITERAKTHPEEVFNNLFSLLNYELLWYAFRRLKRGKTPGVDDVTVEDYEENLRGKPSRPSRSTSSWQLSSDAKSA